VVYLAVQAPYQQYESGVYRSARSLYRGNYPAQISKIQVRYQVTGMIIQ
jgi:hypothetical protein